MKMHNLGTKSKSLMAEGEKERVHYPSFYVSGDKFPEIDKMKVGDEKIMTVKMKMRSYSKRDGDDGSHSNADFDVMAMGCMDKKHEKDVPKSEKDKAHDMMMEELGKMHEEEY